MKSFLVTAILSTLLPLSAQASAPGPLELACDLVIPLDDAYVSGTDPYGDFPLVINVNNFQEEAGLVKELTTKRAKILLQIAYSDSRTTGLGETQAPEKQFFAELKVLRSELIAPDLDIIDSSSSRYLSSSTQVVFPAEQDLFRLALSVGILSESGIQGISYNVHCHWPKK